MMAAFMIAPTASILLVLVLAVIVLAGLVGLALLVVGLLKRRPVLWISGIVVTLVAGLALVAGVAAVFLVAPYACTPSPDRRPPRVTFKADGPRTGSAERGNYVRIENGRGMARAEGVDFEVLEPGNGRCAFATSSTHMVGRSESRCEITLGDVHIVVKKRDGRIDFAVDGQHYGDLHEGDSVVIDEARKVTVNEQRQ